MPQVPQWLVLVCVLTQELLQKVWPPGQLQLVPTQVRPPVQALPQLPQWLLLFCVLTQLPLQSCKPLLQTQLPETQERWPVQALPQLPQCEPFVFLSVHCPLTQAGSRFPVQPHEPELQV